MSGRPPSGLLKNAWFAAWGHAAYKISSEIGINCRLLFQRAPSPEISWRCQAATKNVQRPTFNVQHQHPRGERSTSDIGSRTLDVGSFSREKSSCPTNSAGWDQGVRV